MVTAEELELKARNSAGDTLARLGFNVAVAHTGAGYSALTASKEEREFRFAIEVDPIVGGFFYLQVYSYKHPAWQPHGGVDDVYESFIFKVRFFHRGDLPACIKAGMRSKIASFVREDESS